MTTGRINQLSTGGWGEGGWAGERGEPLSLHASSRHFGLKGGGTRIELPTRCASPCGLTTTQTHNTSHIYPSPSSMVTPLPHPRRTTAHTSGGNQRTNSPGSRNARPPHTPLVEGRGNTRATAGGSRRLGNLPPIRASHTDPQADARGNNAARQDWDHERPTIARTKRSSRGAGGQRGETHQGSTMRAAARRGGKRSLELRSS